MGPLDLSGLAPGALVLVDAAPIIYFLEAHPRYGARFQPLFDRQAAGEIRFAVATVAIAEVLSGPLGAGDEALAKRYRSVMESWHVVDLNVEIAETAARFRATYKLKLPDAIQLASAIAVHADALATHDRDFSKVTAIPILA